MSHMMTIDDEIEVSCLPLFCIKIKPTKLLRATPFMDCLLNLVGLAYRSLIFYFMKVLLPYQPPRTPHLLMGAPIYFSLVLALQNIWSFKKTIRNRYACSFKLYDWVSTYVTLLIDVVCSLYSPSVNLLPSHSNAPLKIYSSTSP